MSTHQPVPFNEAIRRHNTATHIECFICHEHTPLDYISYYDCVASPHITTPVVPVCIECRLSYLEPPTNYLASRPCEYLPQG